LLSRWFNSIRSGDELADEPKDKKKRKVMEVLDELDRGWELLRPDAFVV
jgi:hypothetical protein